MSSSSETTELARYWRVQINSWRTSGDSQASYCKSHDLSYHQFTYWRRKIDQGRSESGGFALVKYQKAVTSNLSVALPNGLVVRGIGADNVAVARELLASLT